MQEIQEQSPAQGSPTGPAGPTGSEAGPPAGPTGPGGWQSGWQAKALGVPEYAEAVAMKYVPPVAGVLVILVLAWMLAAWARGSVRRALGRARFDPTLSIFLSNALRWAILAAAALMCLNLFGVEPAAFAALIAAAGLAIGLAFQGSLSNLAAGIMLLIFRPFKVGDAVNVAGQGGTVNEVDLMMTAVDTADGRRVIIPNSQIFGAIIENITYHPRRRADVAVGVAYSADIDQTRAVLERVARSIPGALADPAPGVALTGLGDSSVNWLVMVWAKRENFGDVRQATIRAVKLALDEAGIEIPFPQRDVWVRSARGVEGLGGETGGK